MTGKPGGNAATRPHPQQRAVFFAFCNIVSHRPFRPDATQCYRILRRSKNRPCVTGALARPIRPCFHPHGWPGAPAILICWAEEPCSGWIEAGLAAWRGGEVLDLLAGLAGEELAHGRYQRLDALAQPLVALARALVRRAGLFGQGLYPRAKAVVHLCDLDGQLAQVHGDFVNVALRAAPQAAEFLAVFAAFLREACGDMLDAFEAFFGGHGFLQYSANCSTAIRPGFQKNRDRTAQPSVRAHCPFSKPAARPALPWSIENKGVIIIGFARQKNSERTAQPLLRAHFHPRIRPPRRTNGIMKPEVSLLASTTLSLEQEKNPWLAAEARFDEAATRLNLDDGLRK